MNEKDKRELWNAVGLYAQTFADRETMSTPSIRADAIKRVNAVVEMLITQARRVGCYHNVCRNGVCVECGRRP